LPKIFGDEAVVSSSSKYDMSKKENLGSFKIEQDPLFSSLNKTLESLVEELPLSTKKLSQVKYLKEKFKKVKGDMQNIQFSRLQW
jgi:hypothetical protein